MTQPVGEPVPIVTWPSLSSPMIAGEVPQEESEGDEPPVATWPAKVCKTPAAKVLAVFNSGTVPPDVPVFAIAAVPRFAPFVFVTIKDPEALSVASPPTVTADGFDPTPCPTGNCPAPNCRTLCWVAGSAKPADCAMTGPTRPARSATATRTGTTPFARRSFRSSAAAVKWCHAPERYCTGWCGSGLSGRHFASHSSMTDERRG